MAMDYSKIGGLIIKYYNEELSEAEDKELKDWLNLSEENRLVFESLADPSIMISKLEMLERVDKQAEWEKILGQIAPRKEVQMTRTRWGRYVAAAAIVGAMVIGGYLWLHRSSLSSRKEIVKQEDPANGIKNDIPPGGNKAILKLANGNTIVLDSAHNGMLYHQDGASIEKKSDGKLAYKALHEKATEIQFNTLSTPRGGQYFVELSDGSKVWLNAASSLRYPVSFTGKDRLIELSGEAYFEVAKNKVMPFHVKVKDVTVEVLGTHFNVNAYDDEDAMKTTLLEGAVRIVKENAGTLMKPGQQVQVNKNGNVKLITEADMEQAVAWKNGNFQFNSNDIETVMRQLARWYDVGKVVYEGKKTAHSFSGTISREYNASDVLKILELSNVHFRIEGKTIIVMQ